jgi:ketosteroid isomerase-like protein
MSENLDLVRSIYAAWERGDFTSAEWADSDIEYARVDLPDSDTWTGPAQSAEAWRDYLSAWKEYRFAVDHYWELDDERVLVLIRRGGRGKASGLELDQMGTKGAHLFCIREGKVTRLVAYLDRDRALADLGLEEQAVAEKSTMPDPAELLRRLVEAANRRDLDAVMTVFAPNCVWDDSAIGLGTREGLTAIRQHIEAWFGSYEEFDWVPEEHFDLGNGVRFAVSIQKGRPVGSTSYVHQRFATVTVWVEGLIERLTTYPDIDAARAAAERLAQERG